MAKDDYSIIKPVEGLQNIGNVTPIKRREERRKKRKSNRNKEEDQQMVEEELHESNEEKVHGELENEKDWHSIDYCA